MLNHKVIIGGIIKHGSAGVGFKITFPDKEMAQHYKDRFRLILLDDKCTVATNKGYYDNKEWNYR